MGRERERSNEEKRFWQEREGGGGGEETGDKGKERDMRRGSRWRKYGRRIDEKDRGRKAKIP